LWLNYFYTQPVGVRGRSQDSGEEKDKKKKKKKSLLHNSGLTKFDK